MYVFRSLLFICVDDEFLNKEVNHHHAPSNVRMPQNVHRSTSLPSSPLSKHIGLIQELFFENSVNFVNYVRFVNFVNFVYFVNFINFLNLQMLQTLQTVQTLKT